jgi:hypothetical protein
VPNPLWVDARDLLSSQGHSLNTYNLNNAMDFLASNPQLRPSVVKAGGSGNEAAIGAGLGAPTDQIVSTPLAPPQANRSSPAKPSGAGGGRSGASTGGSASTRPAPAPPVAKPQTVNAEDPVSATGDPLQQLVAPAPASSPVAPATAAPAADAEEGGLGTGGRLAVGAAGVTALLTALLGLRGGGGGGMRPRSSLEGEVIPPSPVARTGAPGGPTIEGAVDPIQQLLPSPQRQIEGPAGNQVVPSDSIPMPNETSGPAMTTPTLDDIIAQLVNQTPTGASPAPPQLPPSLPPGGKPMRNITGTTRGTKAPKR